MGLNGSSNLGFSSGPAGRMNNSGYSMGRQRTGRRRSSAGISVSFSGSGGGGQSASSQMRSLMGYSSGKSSRSSGGSRFANNGFIYTPASVQRSGYGGNSDIDAALKASAEENVQNEANKAAIDAQEQMERAKESANRQKAELGIAPTGTSKTEALTMASEKAGAMNRATETAKRRNFSNLTQVKNLALSQQNADTSRFSAEASAANAAESNRLGWANNQLSRDSLDYNTGMGAGQSSGYSDGRNSSSGSQVSPTATNAQAATPAVSGTESTATTISTPRRSFSPSSNIANIAGSVSGNVAGSGVAAGISGALLSSLSALSKRKY